MNEWKKLGDKLPDFNNNALFTDVRVTNDNMVYLIQTPEQYGLTGEPYYIGIELDDILPRAHRMTKEGIILLIRGFLMIPKGNADIIQIIFTYFCSV